MEKLISKKEFVLGTALFLLFYPLEDHNFTGKRLIKKINRALKKELAKYRSYLNNRDKYLELVYISRDLVTKTGEEFLGKGNKVVVTPATTLNMLNHRYPELIEPFKIDNKWIDELNEKHTGEGHTFNSVKYVNMLVKNLNAIENIEEEI